MSSMFYLLSAVSWVVPFGSTMVHMARCCELPAPCFQMPRSSRFTFQRRLVKAQKELLRYKQSNCARTAEKEIAPSIRDPGEDASLHT